MSYIITLNGYPKAAARTPIGAEVNRGIMETQAYADWCIDKDVQCKQEDRLHYISTHHWRVIEVPDVGGPHA